MSGAQRSPADLAAAAYEAIRALNHATFPGQGELTDQHDVYTVLANLSALLHITPQALRQTARWLAREQQAGRIHVVDGEHAGQPSDAVAAIETALMFAGAWVAFAARHVDDAHQGAAHLVIGARPRSRSECDAVASDLHLNGDLAAPIDARTRS